MKNFLACFFTVLVFFYVPLSAEAKSEKKVPVFNMPETRYQSPPKKAGEYVRHDFVFTNTGTGVLKITRVRTGCYCVVSKYDREVQPGKKGIISLSYQIEPEWAGRKVSRSAFVVTNDPKKRQTQLTLGVDVEP